jgi:hypothetical protein
LAAAACAIIRCAGCDRIITGLSKTAAAPVAMLRSIADSSVPAVDFVRMCRRRKLLGAPNTRHNFFASIRRAKIGRQYLFPTKFSVKRNITFGETKYFR